MTYQDFKENVITYLTNELGTSVTISIHPILKNNHVWRDGLTISENNCNISPTIYLDYYYKELKAGTPLQEILGQILTSYQTNRPEESIDISFYTDYQNVSQRILFRLIHAKENEELLKEIPHILYLDLAIVFYCLVSSTSTGSATILIHNPHLAFWNVTTETIYKQALHNTPRLLAPQFKNMSELLAELIDDEPLDDDSPVPMYVLTNTRKLYGAGCLLYPNILASFADKLSSDLYILPSSVHEVILLPADTDTSIAELNEMVSDVNTTQLAAEEILSDHVYFYSRQEASVKIVS